MGTETTYDSEAEYTEVSIESEIETQPEAEMESEAEAETELEAETDFIEESSSLKESESSPKEEVKTSVPEDELKKESSSEADQGLSELETTALPDSKEDKETAFSYPVVNPASRPGTSYILDQMDAFTFSEVDEDAALDWQVNLAACRGSLASCVTLLLFGDIVLCLLLGCLCASIFSRFWKVNR